MPAGFAEFIISKSVGRGGVNLAADVRAVQKLLAGQPRAPRPVVQVTGRIDDPTIAAIEEFQRRVLRVGNPDGRVDPRGRTLRGLLGLPAIPAGHGRRVRRLVVHHTAGAKNATVADIRRGHINRGFNDIGYHAVIRGDGSLHHGRGESLQGAHALGANHDSLGVSLCGNFENETPEAVQIAKVKALLAYWCQFYLVLPTQIFGHRDVGTTATACPGANLYAMLPEIRSYLNGSLSFSRILAWPG